MLTSATQNESSRRRLWIGVVVGLAISLFFLKAWGKYDWCAGWARHYEDLATQHLKDASNPDLPVEEKYDHLIVAEWDEIISQKYKVAAMQPWPFGSYPKAPLVSTYEQIDVLQNLAEKSQVPRSVAQKLQLDLLHSR